MSRQSSLDWQVGDVDCGCCTAPKGSRPAPRAPPQPAATKHDVKLINHRIMQAQRPQASRRQIQHPAGWEHPALALHRRRQPPLPPGSPAPMQDIFDAVVENFAHLDSINTTAALQRLAKVCCVALMCAARLAARRRSGLTPCTAAAACLLPAPSPVCSCCPAPRSEPRRRRWPRPCSPRSQVGCATFTGCAVHHGSTWRSMRVACPGSDSSCPAAAPQA